MSETRVALERSIEALGAAIGRPCDDNDKALKNYAVAVGIELRKMHAARSGDPYEVLANAIQLAIDVFGFASDPGHSGLDTTERANME
jgi:hypothetical protein